MPFLGALYLQRDHATHQADTLTKHQNISVLLSVHTVSSLHTHASNYPSPVQPEYAVCVVLSFWVGMPPFSLLHLETVTFHLDKIC